MCTIITVDGLFSKDELIKRLSSDSMYNRDGYSALFVNSDVGEILIRTMDVDPIISMIKIYDYERVFIHTRLATQGAPALQNTHGFNSEGVFVFHNGSISSSESEHFTVDSQAIAHWLHYGGISSALLHLDTEHFSNVFLVDVINREYFINRSLGGSLFTDGKGNYSTNIVAEISIPVTKGVYSHYLELDQLSDYASGDFTW